LCRKHKRGRRKPRRSTERRVLGEGKTRSKPFGGMKTIKNSKSCRARLERVCWGPALVEQKSGSETGRVLDKAEISVLKWEGGDVYHRQIQEKETKGKRLCLPMYSRGHSQRRPITMRTGIHNGGGHETQSHQGSRPLWSTKVKD